MGSPADYSDLQTHEIRVLALDPGYSSDELSGSLLITRHDPENNEIPRYEALSYTWGDQTNPDSVILRQATKQPEGHFQNVDGGSSTKPLAIGRNLGAALRQLRHEKDTRMLWCDSICINQQDLSERAAQVRRMGDIFKHAWRVIAWLGPADDLSPLAVRSLSDLAAYIELSNEENDIFAGKLQLKLETSEVFTNADKQLPLSEQQWHAIDALISRSWFRRLWVRQEIILAGKSTLAVAGDDSIPWIHFSAAFELIAIKRTTSAMTAVHMAVDIHNVRTFSQMRYLRNFSQLVAFTHDCEVTDPRDLVYGLLGIASGSFTRNIAIDYNKPVKDVYRDAIVCASTWHQNLILLSFCDSASKPTWVPDLDRTKNFRAITLGRAGLASSSEARVLDEIQAEAKGIRCDTIVEVLGPATDNDGATQDQLRGIVIEAARRYLGPDPSIWEEDRLKQFCLALLAADYAVHPRQIERHKAYLAPWISPEGKVFAVPGDSKTQLFPFIYYLRGRSLYLTRMGYIMLGPRGCQYGDTVCVFLGSNLPTVLRPVSNGKYQIKGPACHPALFFGEALLGEMPKGWVLKYYTLHLEPIFENSEGKQQDIDPRLGDQPIPTGWELRRRKDGTPFFYSAERDRWTNFDPRASEEQLRKQGVKIQTFTIT